MKVGYDILISPYSLSLEKVGHIRSPTLREVFSPAVTYHLYKLYISILLLTPQAYFDEIRKDNKEWFTSLSDEERSKLTMFDLTSADVQLQHIYQDIFNLFFEEDVLWSAESDIAGFFVKDNEHIIGFIHRENFSDVLDVILQRCAVGAASAQKPKFKNKKVQDDWERKEAEKRKLQKNTQKSDLRFEIPNIISAYAASNHSNINMINIWDLTIFQLRDQFEREQYAQGFDINKMSVAHWGDKENHFDMSSWFKILR